MPRCPNCKREQPPSEFNKKTASATGLQSLCKDCNKEFSAASNKRRRQDLETAREHLRVALAMLEKLSL